MFSQFRALGKDQREAILKALNDDAEKLISEYGTDAMRDPDIARLREQMRECNRHFNQLTSQCADDGTCPIISSANLSDWQPSYCKVKGDHYYTRPRATASPQLDS